jgi:nonribosomal peptide synthetase DhbF
MNVHILTAPPSVLALMPASHTPTIHTVIFAGEPCPPALVQKWSRPGRRVFNAYGPTEATVCATWAQCDPADDAVTIGHPLPNVSIYLLDEHGAPVQPGTVGEIYIGGIGVADGYLHRPDLTSQRFVPNPYHAERLYRTGDLARSTPDGSLQYIGRSDRQLKIHGHRIEPAEIESVILNQPGITSAACITVDDKIIAYFTTNPGHDCDPSVLRQATATSLPTWMIPNAFIPLDTLPLTPNGKLDRTQLPTPKLQVSTSLEPARTNTERVLVRLWRCLFGRTDVCVNQDFFSCGGHSLLAVRFVTEARAAFNLRVEETRSLLQTFLETRTIRNFAQKIETAATAAGAPVEIFFKDAAFDTTAPRALPLDNKNWTNPKSVLLTGATGFLGSYLLVSLIRNTSAKVTCVIRSDDEMKARARLHEILSRAGLWHNSMEKRLEVLVGDLSSQHLGLTSSTYQHLATSVDSIYHSAAAVNFLYPYEALRETNVCGTRRILEFAAEAGNIPVNHVSTLAVLVNHQFIGARHVEEDASLILPDRLYMGYPESKWTAELLLHNARTSGYDTRIYRPHDIGGESRSGYWRSDNTFIVALIKSFIDMGIAPDCDLPIDIVPVDEVAEMLVRISLHPSSVASTFHLNNPAVMSLSDLIELCVDLAMRSVRCLMKSGSLS